MSNINDFKGGTGAEVGQVVGIAGGNYPVHSTNGRDYLITGTLAPIASYPLLETTHPGLCVAAGVALKRAVASAEGIYGVAYAGTTYYTMSQNETIKQSADTTTWSALTGTATANNNSDVAVFGSYLMDCDSAGSNCGYTLNGVRAAQATLNTNGCFYFAVNAAGTLAVGHGSGTVCCTATTANGTWTLRTDSMTSSFNGTLTWSQVGSSFISLSTDGKAWTSTDGFTQTDRGVISGISGIAAVASLPNKSAYCVNTASATLMSVMATPTGGTSAAHLIRTTNGTSFTATPWATVLGLDSRNGVSSAPRMSNVAGVIYVWSAPKNSQQGGFIYKSADSGATWTRVVVPVYLPLAAAGAFVGFSYANSILFGVNNDTANKSWIYSFASPVVATHVGQARADDLSIATSYSAGTSLQVPYYVRVK